MKSFKLTDKLDQIMLTNQPSEESGKEKSRENNILVYKM